MRVVLAILLLVLLPSAIFFVWAWCRTMVRERKLTGTLPEWQNLPWTWLIIAGLVLAIAGTLYLFLITERPQGGWLSGERLPAAIGVSPPTRT